MRIKLQIVSIIAVLCVVLGINVSAAKLKDGKLTIDASSGKITKPFIVKEIDGVKYLIGVSRGMVEYEIDIPEDGEYIIWGKAYGVDGTKDSFFVIVDKMPEMIWDVSISKEKKTRWLKIRGRKNFKNSKIELKKGKHKIVLKGRETGTVLEKLFIGKANMKPQK